MFLKDYEIVKNITHNNRQTSHFILFNGGKSNCPSFISFMTATIGHFNGLNACHIFLLITYKNKNFVLQDYLRNTSCVDFPQAKCGPQGIWPNEYQHFRLRGS